MRTGEIPSYRNNRLTSLKFVDKLNPKIFVGDQLILYDPSCD